MNAAQLESDAIEMALKTLRLIQLLCEGHFEPLQARCYFSVGIAAGRR